MQSADKSIYWLINSRKPNNPRMYQLVSSKAYLLINSPTCQIIASPLNSPTQKNTNSKKQK